MAKPLKSTPLIFKDPTTFAVPVIVVFPVIDEVPVTVIPPAVTVIPPAVIVAPPAVTVNPPAVTPIPPVDTVKELLSVLVPVIVTFPVNPVVPVTAKLPGIVVNTLVVPIVINPAAVVTLGAKIDPVRVCAAATVLVLDHVKLLPVHCKKPGIVGAVINPVVPGAICTNN